MNRNNQKKKILNATRRIAITKGVNALSIEAVAKETNLSKGGLLYHFPTKFMLLKGLIDDWLEEFNRIHTKYRLKDSRPGGWCRSYVSANLARHDARKLSSGRLGIATLAANAYDQKLLSPIVDEMKKRQASLESDGIDINAANVVRLAVDGIWMNEMLGINILSAEQLEGIIKYLENMTKE